jgi:hypothetical protein
MRAAAMTLAWPTPISQTATVADLLDSRRDGGMVVVVVVVVRCVVEVMTCEYWRW